MQGRTPSHFLTSFGNIVQTGLTPQSKATCQDYLNIARERVKAVVEDSFAQRDMEFRGRIELLEASSLPKD